MSRAYVSSMKCPRGVNAVNRMTAAGDFVSVNGAQAHIVQRAERGRGI